MQKSGDGVSEGIKSNYQNIMMCVCESAEYERRILYGREDLFEMV